MRNILVRTTFKDDLILLKAFYKFYSAIWNPQTFIFYIGYSRYDEAKIINDINEILNIKISYRQDSTELSSLILNTKIYIHENLHFVLYKTNSQTNAATWDGVMRPFLYRSIEGLPSVRSYKYFLNLDNDDFFYVRDVDSLLCTSTVLRVHTFEFISHNIFNLEDDFEFISLHYYYRLKGAKKLEAACKNSHLWCRALYFTEPYRNETHVGRADGCAKFDELKPVQFDQLDNVCFAFGCIDLNYLIHSKSWLQSSAKDTSKFKYSREEVIANFHDYYRLTEKERQNNIIVKCNELKTYFL